MAKFRGAIVVDTEKCKGCNLCVVACPTKTLDLAKEVNGKGYHYSEMVNPEASHGDSHVTQTVGGNRNGRIAGRK